MVTIASLWLPILLSAIFVFIASAIIWTVMPHHQKDFKELPDEPAARSTLTPQNVPPGQYNIPHVASREAVKDPEVVKLFDEGPVAFLTVLPKGMPNMGRSMLLSLVYYLVVGGVVAYLTTRTVPPGAEYLAVFRVSGTIAWAAYGLGTVPDAIWFGRPWSAIFKNMLDALIYGSLTGGAFAALWPH